VVTAVSNDWWLQQFKTIVWDYFTVKMKAQQYLEKSVIEIVTFLG
jgi:hypothetical protein